MPLGGRGAVHAGPASRSAPPDSSRRRRTAASQTGRRTAVSGAPTTGAPRSAASDAGARDLASLCGLRELRLDPSFHLLVERSPEGGAKTRPVLCFGFCRHLEPEVARHAAGLGTDGDRVQRPCAKAVIP